MQFPDRPQEKVYTSGQLALKLGVHYITLHEWRKKRTGPPYTKINGRVFYAEGDVVDWLNKGRVAG